MAIYFIDGDNSPGGRTCGVQWLTAADKVIVFYNDSNAFYKAEKNRKALADSTRAKVLFEQIPNFKNSVDFAIAVKAGVCVSKDSAQQIFLVSSDNHFEQIAALIRREIGSRSKVCRVDQVWRGILTDERNLTDLTMVKELLQGLLGTQEGNVLWRRMQSLCREDAEVKAAELQTDQDSAIAASPASDPAPTQNPQKHCILHPSWFSGWGEISVRKIGKSPENTEAC